MNATTVYDEAIRAAVTKYLPVWPWPWIKAQLIAESDLDPDAISHDGAQGIAQFMPATWADVSELLDFPHGASAFDPKYAIPGAVWYVAKIRSWWTSYRTEDDRRRLTQASYNAGFGSISNAQRVATTTRGEAVNDYAGIIAFLPQITGLRSQETIAYVARIEKLYTELTGAAP